MTQEQQAIQQYVDWLIEQGNMTILQRNSRAKRFPFVARLRGEAFESCLPLVLIAFGCAIVWLIRWAFLIAYGLQEVS